MELVSESVQSTQYCILFELKLKRYENSLNIFGMDATKALRLLRLNNYS